MSALPSFTLTGNMNDVLVSVGASQVATSVWGTVRILLTHNLTDGILVWQGKVFNRPPEIVVAADGNGNISQPLLANDPGLNVTGVQWNVEIQSPRGTHVTSFWINAPANGATADLGAIVAGPVAAVHAAPPVIIANLISDATTLGKGLLQAPTSAAACSLLGVNQPPTGATVLTSPSPPVKGQITRYNATAGPLAVTLPALSGLNPGDVYGVQNYVPTGTSATNTVTFTAAGSDTFDSGATTETLRLPGELRLYQALQVGATKYWKVVGGNTTIASLDARYAPLVVVRGPNTIASSATPSINADTTAVFGITALTTAITAVTVTGTFTDGQRLRVYIVGTASRAITWGTQFEASTIALPTTTSGTNRLDLDFIYNAATSKWRVLQAV